jgi:hypothetical protein
MSQSRLPPAAIEAADIPVFNIPPRCTEDEKQNLLVEYIMNAVE